MDMPKPTDAHRQLEKLAGAWIGERLNRMEGPVRFLIPEGGVSLLDQSGRSFHDPAADAALFRALETTVRQTPRRQPRKPRPHRVWLNLGKNQNRSRHTM